ncbi:MAG: DUF4258 domain-containing protein [Phycisphaeraceae bacterium]|nr:DUF4258 domain-containing protein [Phycisphaerales bacterium]QOJ18617.1 MAG: DUF4258 domain-containing protein [Phycisphaeraceae bacterium]
MNTNATRAHSTIRRCIEAERFRLSEHFAKRMDDRGLFWADVLAAIDAPTRFEPDGFDAASRARWIVEGPCADGAPIGIVCAIGRDDAGELTVFVTLYWER